MSNTIQTIAVKQALEELVHASNLQLLERVTKKLPGLSATTVHRITTRLIENGEIGYAPSSGRAVVLDADPKPHDHFVCKDCGGIKDIVLSDAVRLHIQEQLDEDKVEDGLVICGRCASCKLTN